MRHVYSWFVSCRKAIILAAAVIVCVCWVLHEWRLEKTELNAPRSAWLTLRGDFPIQRVNNKERVYYETNHSYPELGIVKYYPDRRIWNIWNRNPTLERAVSIIRNNYTDSYNSNRIWKYKRFFKQGDFREVFHPSHIIVIINGPENEHKTAFIIRSQVLFCEKSSIAEVVKYATKASSAVIRAVEKEPGIYDFVIPGFDDYLMNENDQQ